MDTLNTLITNNYIDLFLFIMSVLYSYFIEAALEIYNSETVSITNSRFSNNTGSGIILEPYRGNTGSVAITYFNSSRSNQNPDIKVINTTFINNSVYAKLSYRFSSRTFYRGLLTGRAGGLGVFIYEIYHNVTIHVDGCTFHDNYAQAYGGGMYIVYSGRNSHHTGTVSNCEFNRNTGGLGGGGSAIGMVSSGLDGAPHILNIKNCLYKSNRGNKGGGLLLAFFGQGGRGKMLSVTRCMFIDNAGIDVGGALCVSAFQTFEEKESYPVNSMKNWYDTSVCD